MARRGEYYSSSDQYCTGRKREKSEPLPFSSTSSVLFVRCSGLFSFFGFCSFSTRRCKTKQKFRVWLIALAGSSCDFIEKNQNRKSWKLLGGITIEKYPTVNTLLSGARVCLLHIAHFTRTYITPTPKHTSNLIQP